MPSIRPRLASALALVFFASAWVSAQAAEIKVLTTGAFKPVVTALVPAFERRSGHRVEVANDTAGAIVRRIAGGERFDVLVLTPAALQSLAAAGTVRPGSVVPLAKVAIGVAVKEGAAAPDLSTVEAFKQALLNARRVAYIDPAAGGSSGIYLDGLFERMGIAAAVRAKAVLVPGGLVAARLLTGEADLAIHQISEILAVPGATLVAPLPAEIQNHTTYAGAVSAQTMHLEAAQALLETLLGSEAEGVVRAKGMLPPR